MRNVAGMSLVELVAVTTVTAIVACFAVQTGMKAVCMANNAKVITEFSQMTGAMNAFYMCFGDFPPDFRDVAAVKKFLKSRFPKCPPDSYPDLSVQSPASAMFFWLAGPNGRGFSANPANPFDNSPRRIGPFLKFADDRLKKVGGAWQYFPPRMGKGQPYVYFRGGKTGYDGSRGWDSVHPYRNSDTGGWMNSETYQILCAGDDGKFGEGCHYPSGEDYDDANMDDLANFTGGCTMKQSIPKDQ